MLNELIILISFISALGGSALGFGNALIAVPLFMLIMPPGIAVPLSEVLSFVLGLVIVFQDHNKIFIRQATGLLLFSLIGVPFGVIILIYVPESIVKIALSLLIIAFALFILNKSSLKVKPTTSTMGTAGFVSGLLGGAYGMNGPPLVVYGTIVKWPPQIFRATLQGYFLPASVIIIISFIFSGLITRTLIFYALICLPGTLLGIVIGRYLNKLLTASLLRILIFSMLVLLSLSLIFSSL